jgi:hypothetical protein
MTDAIADNNKRRGRGRPPVNSTFIGVRVPPDLMSAVDAWIVEQRDRIPPEELSRPEALRRLAAEALIGMGLLKP